MITKNNQKSYFDTFGFLFLKNLFTQNEIMRMASASEKIFELNEDVDKNGAQQIVPFIDRSTELTRFILDPRIYQVVTNLLGEDFLWVASEGNLTTKTYHEWHPDRTGTQNQIEFKRLKVMFYLNPVTKDTGCLRIIPGSHHYYFHKELVKSIHSGNGVGHDSDISTFCGISGNKLNAHYVESNPGDVVFFNQCLWHSVYNAVPGRRYVSALFTEKPTNKEHIDSLKYYTGDMFNPHDNFVNSTDKKIRRMVDPIATLQNI